jgi:hypothetical protein
MINAEEGECTDQKCMAREKTSAGYFVKLNEAGRRGKKWIG